MNKRTAGFCLVALIISAMMCSLPPWEQDGGPIGYFPVWAPPAGNNCSVDSERLLIQIVVVLLLIASGYLTSTYFKISEVKEEVSKAVTPVAESLDKRRKPIFSVLVIVALTAVSIAPVFILKKMDERKKALALAQEKIALELKLRQDAEKENKIAELVKRDEQAALFRKAKKLASPLRWPIVLKERQMRGVATTRWQNGSMVVNLELNSTPELIELSQARGEYLQVYFVNKKTGLKVGVPIEPHNLVIQKDRKGAWSRLVMTPMVVAVGSAEYESLNGIVVYYSNSGL